MIRLQRKICAARLKRESVSPRDYARAETVVGAVYEGGGVAVFVGDGEVDCIAGVHRGAATISGDRGDESN